MNSKCFNYLNYMEEILEKICTTQWREIDGCSKAMAEAMAAGHSVFIFAQEYAGIPAGEILLLADGLAFSNIILPHPVNPPSVCSSGPIGIVDTPICNSSEALLRVSVREGDFLLLYSVSEHCKATVDLALDACKNGAVTAAVTSLSYSANEADRRFKEFKLSKICNYVIDNCGGFSDSCILLPGIRNKIAPTSGVSGYAILNMLIIRTLEYMLEMGLTPIIPNS